MRRNGNGSLERRVALLEDAYLEDRKRWKKNDERLEAILRVIHREIRKNEERWQKNETRWQKFGERFQKTEEALLKSDARIETLFQWLYQKMEGEGSE